MVHESYFKVKLALIDFYCVVFTKVLAAAAPYCFVFLRSFSHPADCAIYAAFPLDDLSNLP